MTGGRVLHCIPGMGGGGAERQLAYLADALPRFGWEVHVSLTSAGPNFDRLVRAGARIHRIVARNNYDPRIAWQLLRTVRRIKPDIIQVWLLQMEIVGAFVAASHRIPWIVSERSSELAYPQTLKSRLRVAVTSRAAAIVSNSEAGDRYWSMQARGTLPRFVVPNAVPHREIEATAPADMRRMGFSSSDRLILFMGRFSPEKNVLALHRALQTLLPEIPGVAAVLAGDGPLTEAVRAARDSAGLGNRIALPGYLDEPWSWMKRADIFASVSHFEGHPNTVLEAVASRCPVVLSDIPAHRAILDRTCALFVPPGDVAAIASAIRGVLSDHQSARIRAARAYDTISDLRIDRIARRYDEIYRHVLGRQCRQTPVDGARTGEAAL